MRSFNAGKVCEAIVQCLEERAGQSRAGVRWPEQEHHPFPVEVAFTIGDQLFALEHTGIEPFRGYVWMNAEADRHFKPIVDALNDYLGKNALFELIIPAKTLQGRKMPEVRAIQQAIIDWFKETALTVPSVPFGDHQHPSVGPVTIPGVPFPVSMNRFEPTVISTHPFDIKHTIFDAEQLRIDPVREAIEREFPKLAAWKRVENAKTILVLESNTISLADHVFLAQTFMTLAMARADRPDETYLVDSSRNPWLVLPILIDSKSFFDFLESSEAQRSQFDPTMLVPLTIP